MRFAYCPETGEEPGEVFTMVALPVGATVSVALDGEGRPLRQFAGDPPEVGEVTEEIAWRIPDNPRIQTAAGRACEWRYRFDAERNEQGQLLLNMAKVAAVLPGHTRYNGGGVKQIERLDKSKTDGWSLIGEYCPERAHWCNPGLYLDISKAGSRKSISQHYQLFRIYPDGTVACVGSSSTSEHGKSWATALWPVIDRELAEIAGEPILIAPATSNGNGSDPGHFAGDGCFPGELTEEEQDALIRAYVRLMRALPEEDRATAHRVITAAVIDGNCLDCGGEPDPQMICIACGGSGRIDGLGYFGSNCLAGEGAAA